MPESAARRPLCHAAEPCVELPMESAGDEHTGNYGHENKKDVGSIDARCGGGR